VAAEDKKWLAGEFGALATKVEFNALKTDVEGLKTHVAVLAADMSFVKGEVTRMSEGFGRVEVLANKMLTAAEKLGGRVDTLEQENKMGAATLQR